MKLKITIGKLSYVDQLSPIKQQDFEVSNPQESVEAFKTFFTDNPDLSLPQDVELILQSGEPMTINTVFAIKYLLAEKNIGLEFYAFEEDEDEVLDNISLTSGMLLLDEAQKYYGFIPKGYFLRFTSEEDANPVKVYTWINDTVRLFPSTTTDVYGAILDEVKEYSTIMGVVSNSVINRLSKILATFNKRTIVI